MNDSIHHPKINWKLFEIGIHSLASTFQKAINQIIYNMKYIQNDLIIF